MLDPEKLQINHLISSSSYKKDATISMGEYEGSPVIIKQGGEELLREATILKKISHPSFPSVVEHIQTETSQTLILQYLEGRPLDDFIELGSTEKPWESRVIPLEDTYKIIHGLASSFEVLKNAGYLYRDLNLNHVILGVSTSGLVDVEWSVPIDENGLAIVDSEAGTWETMAPEEFQVGNQISEASTVYTLGVVLVQLLTGRNPFYIPKETIPDTTLRRQATYELHAKIPRLEIHSSQLSKLVHTCLDPSPSNRYRSIELFKYELSKVISGEVSTPL